MGWTRFLLLGDLGQQFDIHDNEAGLARLGAAFRASARRDTQQDERLAHLESDIVQLRVALTALVTLLRDKNLATDAEVDAALSRAMAGAERAAAARDAAEKTKAADHQSRVTARRRDRKPRRT